MEERYLTVTALTKYIKYKFDHDYHLEDVLLEGEISNFKHNSRGHFYFTLKDDSAQISATMFVSSARNVKFEPTDGMKVFVRGNVTVYEPSGTYQINVKEMKSSGLGDLYLAYEKLKKELEKEGLFDPIHKKPIPRFPKTIGVITSPTGAAIKDIINTITRRYPLCSVILYPAIVQGTDSKDDVAKQIKKANSDNLCDVLIVGRGGGSIEDLWAFNEKVVAYAIYESNIPIISAVGHEIDFTIADFVSDVRAATPTAAAEIATPNIDTLKQNIASFISCCTEAANSSLFVTKTGVASLSCSAWDRISAATNLGFAVSSAITKISVGPATISIPTVPKTSFFAKATKIFPGPTILSTLGIVCVPYAKAAIAPAPPTLNTVFTPDIFAATNIAGLIFPFFWGGVHI